ncbi:ATP-binding cassette domain-containing protein [Lachnospiraceae bacterium ZAX-1]
MEYRVQIKNMSKHFRKRVLFSNVDFMAEKGKIVGIAGGNGCGKSVLFKMIAGLERYSQGEIYVDGRQIGKEVDYPENTGILINAPGYLEQYSGFMNLKYLAEINHKIDDSSIKKTMVEVGLNPEEALKVKHYSVGMKQKLGVAQAIMEGQTLLILDEIFNGLDTNANARIKKILLKKAEESATILLTSHNFNDLKDLCDTIYQIENEHIHLLNATVQS